MRPAQPAGRLADSVGHVLDRCERLPGVVERYPGERTWRVFEVRGWSFAVVRPQNNPVMVTLRCKPELARLLRQRHPAVVPGYHTDKRHWNTVMLDGSVAATELARHGQACVCARRRGRPVRSPAVRRGVVAYLTP